MANNNKLIFDYPESIAASNSNSNSNSNSGWQISYIVGKFGRDAGNAILSEPLNPDKIFKVYFKITNGTIISVDQRAAGVRANIIADKDNGLLEVRFPRNYPYVDIGQYSSSCTDIICNPAPPTPGPLSVFVEGPDQPESLSQSSIDPTTGCFFT